MNKEYTYSSSFELHILCSFSNTNLLRSHLLHLALLTHWVFTRVPLNSDSATFSGIDSLSPSTLCARATFSGINSFESLHMFLWTATLLLSAVSTHLSPRTFSFEQCHCYFQRYLAHLSSGIMCQHLSCSFELLLWAITLSSSFELLLWAIILSGSFELLLWAITLSGSFELLLWAITLSGSFELLGGFTDQYH